MHGQQNIKTLYSCLNKDRYTQHFFLSDTFNLNFVGISQMIETNYNYVF